MKAAPILIGAGLFAAWAAWQFARRTQPQQGAPVSLAWGDNIAQQQSLSDAAPGFYVDQLIRLGIITRSGG